MTTCPDCGGTVQDNVCTDCGTSVWPQATTGDAAQVPPPTPSAGTPGAAGTSETSDGSGTPGFVNPPDDTPPPPPSTPGAASQGTPSAASGTPPSSAGVPPSSPGAPPPPAPGTPPPGGSDGGWQPSPATADGAAVSSGSSRRTLWWVLGGLAVLAVVGVLAVWLFLRSAGLSPGEIERVGEGSPERLAELRAGCEAGDMQACDDLYLESPFDSEDEAFGDTCGGRNEPSGWCVDIHGETAPPS